MSEVKKFIVDGQVIGISNPELKTINGESLLGSGDIEIQYSEGDNISISDNIISAKGYTYDDSSESFSIGQSAQANATGTVAEGNQTVAEGDYSHVEGDWTLGLQTEYDCELNDVGVSNGASVSCIDPDSNIDNKLDSMTLNCPSLGYGGRPGYFLTITIEVSNFYESYLDFHDAILAYDGQRYKIKDYLIPNTFKSEHENSNSPSTIYVESYSNNYEWETQFDGIRNINNNSDFIVLSRVVLHRENDDNSVELNNIIHGRGKIILVKNGLVTGQASHSEGGVNIITGTGSHAEGVNNTVIGNYSHAEGMNNYIEGDYSHAEGTNNKIYGIASHAQGVENVINADSATCMGTGLIVNYNCQTIIGRYNSNEDIEGHSISEYCFIVGCGENENSRKNAYAIRWTGGTWKP